jgi:hypothetical protein
MQSGRSSTPEIPANEISAAQLVYGGLPTTGSVYMRGFFLAETAPPFGAIPLLAVQTASGTFKSQAVLLDSTGMLTTSDTVFGTGGTTSVSFPLRQWVCVELSITYATAGQLRVSVNGVDQPTLALSGDSTTAGTSQFASGIYASSTSAIPAYAMALDEVAIDSAPIGCTH